MGGYRLPGPWEFFWALANGRNYDTPKSGELGSDQKLNQQAREQPTESQKLKICKAAPW